MKYLDARATVGGEHLLVPIWPATTYRNFSSTQSLSFHLQGAVSEARARQTFASDPRSGSGAVGLRVADLQAGMGSVRSRRYYPAYSIRKQYKSPLHTTHDEEMERRRRGYIEKSRRDQLNQCLLLSCVQ